MLNYEIAKELKEAGFKQGVGNYLSCHPKEGIAILKLQPLKEEGGPNKEVAYCACGASLYYAPTLSELIEACGEGFGQLEKQEGYWECTGRDLTDGIIITFQQGSTPEEAVARLYLALNKK